MMKLIVGLGNPGRQYEQTRHNLGYKVLDCLARRWGVQLQKMRFEGLFAMKRIGQTQAALLKPLTFMNNSGRSVAAAVRYYKLPLENLLVISDDMALPLGQLRLRPSGSDGGHKGLADIILHCGDDRFARLRIGIDCPPGRIDPADYVLSPFRADEQPVVEQAVQQAADAVEMWLEKGIEATMNVFNRRDRQN